MNTTMRRFHYWTPRILGTVFAIFISLFALGLVSTPFTGFPIAARYWGDYSSRYGTAWIKKETEGANRHR